MQTAAPRISDLRQQRAASPRSRPPSPHNAVRSDPRTGGGAPPATTERRSSRQPSPAQRSSSAGAPAPSKRPPSPASSHAKGGEKGAEKRSILRKLSPAGAPPGGRRAGSASRGRPASGSRGGTSCGSASKGPRKKVTFSHSSWQFFDPDNSKEEFSEKHKDISPPPPSSGEKSGEVILFATCIYTFDFGVFVQEKSSGKMAQQGRA